MNAKLEPSGIDYGAAGFGVGFTVSESLDRACCPNPQKLEASVIASSVAENATNQKVAIEEVTVATVSAVAATNDNRTASYTSQTPSTSNQEYTPASQNQTANTTATSNSGGQTTTDQSIYSTPSTGVPNAPVAHQSASLDYGSATFGFDMGGGGFALSESLTGDCCNVDSIAFSSQVNSQQSETSKQERKQVAIEVATVAEVSAVATSNDNKSVAQVEVKENVPRGVSSAQSDSLSQSSNSSTPSHSIEAKGNSVKLERPQNTETPSAPTFAQPRDVGFLNSRVQERAEKMALPKAEREERDPLINQRGKSTFNVSEGNSAHARKTDKPAPSTGTKTVNHAASFESPRQVAQGQKSLSRETTMPEVQRTQNNAVKSSQIQTNPPSSNSESARKFLLEKPSGPPLESILKRGDGNNANARNTDKPAPSTDTKTVNHAASFESPRQVVQGEKSLSKAATVPEVQRTQNNAVKSSHIPTNPSSSNRERESKFLLEKPRTPLLETILKRGGRSDTGVLERTVKLQNNKSITGSEKVIGQDSTKNINQDSGLKADRSLTQRVLEGVRSIPRLFKTEKDPEKTQTVRLTSLATNELHQDKAPLVKRVIETVKERTQEIKEQIIGKFARIGEKFAETPVVKQVMAISHKLSQVVQRIQIPERIQNSVRLLRGRLRDEPVQVIRLSRESIADTAPTKAPVIKSLIQTAKLRVKEFVSEQIRKVASLPGIKQAVFVAKKAAEFMSKLRRGEQNIKEVKTQNETRIVRLKAIELESPSKSIRRRITSHLVKLMRNEVDPVKKQKKNTREGKSVTKKPESPNTPKLTTRQLQKAIDRLVPRKSIENKKVPKNGQIVSKNERVYSKGDNIWVPKASNQLSGTSKNRIASNLSKALTLKQVRVVTKKSDNVRAIPEPKRTMKTIRLATEEMAKLPLKQLNSQRFLQRQAKKGNLLLLYKLRRRGLRGSQFLKKHLDPKSMLYRRLIRELSLDELEKFLKGMAAQKARRETGEFYYQPRKKKFRKTPSPLGNSSTNKLP